MIWIDKAGILSYHCIRLFLYLFLFRHLFRLITSRLETNVLRVLGPYFTAAKDPRVKQSLTRATSLFGKALHPTHLHIEYVFPKRDALLKFVQVQFVISHFYMFNFILDAYLQV